jgi:hypothetical protein
MGSLKDINKAMKETIPSGIESIMIVLEPGIYPASEN